MVLEYDLSSPSGVVELQSHKIESKPIVGDPKSYHAALVGRVERPQRRYGAGGSLLARDQIRRELEGIGHDLFHKLFSSEMRQAYREFREKVRTVRIISDEPWIPWELIKPYDDEPDPIIDDDFLCGRFRFTRWLAGKAVAPAEIPVASLACINAGQASGSGLPNLPHAPMELDLLAGLARRHPGVADRSPETPTHPVVMELLATGELDLVHVVGHGNFIAARPDEASILLADGRPFCAQDLHGPLQTQAGRGRPLVFLNACQAGRQAFSLTGLAGWAERWVTRSRCGAFIAPLWAVDDRLAYEFVRTFYCALERGRTFGQAAQAARRRVRKLDPGEPTWLAFAVWAHPCGRLILGSTAAPRPRTARLAADATEPEQEPPEPPLGHRILFGRDTEVEGILERLEREQRSRNIISISGLGGIGKTALAEEITRRVREAASFSHVIWETAKEEYFDGTEVVRRYSGPPVTIEGLLAVIAHKLGFAESLHKKDTTAEKIYLAQQHLKRERCLLVLDNLETISDYRQLVSDLTALFKHSQAILTSRFSLAAYDAIRDWHLKALPLDASLDLLRHELEERSPLTDVEVDDDDLKRIHEATGGLPLAMKLIIGRILSTAAPLDYLLRQFRDVDWEDDDSIYRDFYSFIYWDIWRTLSPSAKILLIKIGSKVPAGEPSESTDLQRISEQPDAIFHKAMEELIRASLVEYLRDSESEPGQDRRYELHPLTRHFVADRLETAFS